MIVLVTDFGLEGPYLGQVRGVLWGAAPEVPVVDLFADLVPHEPQLAAYLLPPHAAEFPPGTVFLCIVDPGVGSDRDAVVVEADGRWFVGPDNGLFAPLLRRAGERAAWTIDWRPRRLSASFHGRDLFAPVAARLARGMPPGAARDPATLARPDWPDELDRIAYVDRFGNAMTGRRAATLASEAKIEAGGRVLTRARTFADRPTGEAFWYANSVGLVEIAVSQGRADSELSLAPGDPVAVRA